MPRTSAHSAIGRNFSILAALTLFILSGCSRPDQGKSLVIGYVGSRSGANGTLLAAEKLKTLRIVSIDAEAADFKPGKALESLAKSGVQVVIDGSASLAGENSQEGKVSIFAIPPDPKAQVASIDPLETAAEQMADQLWADGILSVSIIYDLADQSYNEKWLNSFRLGFEKNRGVVLKAERVNSSQNGWEKKLPDQVREALIKETRCLVVVADAESASLITQEARNLNKSIPLAFAEQAFPTKLLAKAGTVLEGATMVDFTPPASFEKFAKAYAEKFNSPPNLAAACAYDAVGLVISGQSKSKGIVDGIATQTEYTGVFGTTRNNSGKFSRAVTLGRISNGKLLPLAEKAQPQKRS